MQLTAQNGFVKLKSRSFQPQDNLASFSWDAFAKTQSPVEGKYFAVIQFKQTITVQQRALLKLNGIELVEYIPDNTFSVSITQTPSLSLLQSVGAAAIFNLEANDKLHPRLLQKNFPYWAVKQANTVDVTISFSKAIDPSTSKKILVEKGYMITDESWLAFHIITLRIAHELVEQLAAIPFID